MRFNVWWRIRVLLWALILIGVPRALMAQNVCTVADIEARDAGCPAGSDTCLITATLPVGDGCTLDFGERDVAVTSSGGLVVRSGAMTLLARSLNINTGGLIDGRGTEAGATGGIVHVTVTGSVTVQDPNGVIDVSADDGGGMVMIEAAGSIAIGGRLRAVGNIQFGGGGDIILRADGDIISAVGSQIVATGAREGGIGGLIDMTARGRIEVGALLDVDGSDGGEVILYAAQNVIVRAVEARGTSDAGSGGCVGIQADGALLVLETVSTNGTGSSQGSGGGCGGFICLEARYGDLTLRDDITSEGAIPDGGGGSIAIIADAGSIALQPETLVSVRGNGRQGCGGEICVDASIAIDGQALFDSSGGLAGGDVDLSAGKNITIASGVDASGRGSGSCGGTLLVEAGFEAVGALLVTSSLNVGSGGCGDELGCGIGGLAQLIACRVTVTAEGSVDVQAGLAGQIDIVTRDVLAVQGMLTATKTSNDPAAKDGTVEIRHPIGTNPVISGVVRPLPSFTALPKCTEERGITCLVPCPVCGNSVVEFPEGCDNGGGINPVSCDGCSLKCQVESCDDGLNCTVDSCEPERGCRHAPLELPATPCYEPSEATPTTTRTTSPTGTTTPTRTVRPTGSVGVPTPTPTSQVTPTLTPATPAGSCTGDCDGSERVSVNELVRGVNILLGSQDLSECPSFDRDGGGTVTVDELVASVRIALGNGCP
jgi:hypothetical protein